MASEEPIPAYEPDQYGMVRVPAILTRPTSNHGLCQGCVVQGNDDNDPGGPCDENRCRYWEPCEVGVEDRKPPYDYIIIHPSRLEDYKFAVLTYKLDEEPQGDGQGEPWDFTAKE